MTATHILHWVPGYLVRGDCDGWWELQPAAAYDVGEPQLDPDWYLEDEPRDIDAADFAEWIASLVGYPVTVEKDWTDITCWRALRFRRPEPLWLVCPAEVTS
jgi:hypothetical protein